MKRTALAFIIAAAAAFAARGADIYVWTDENGKTHLADSVPPKFRRSAIRIDSSQFELSPEQQREAAAARAALEKKAQSTPAPPLPSPARTAAPMAAAPRPGAAASEPEKDCETLQREYRDSLECFAPYVNANGSLKPGAFAACKSVVNPTLKCGSPKAY